MAEFYDGVVGARDPQRADEELQKFLDNVEVVPLNEPVCRIFAEERVRLRTSGSRIADLDLLIALLRYITVSPFLPTTAGALNECRA